MTLRVLAPKPIFGLDAVDQNANGDELSAQIGRWSGRTGVLAKGGTRASADLSDRANDDDWLAKPASRSEQPLVAAVHFVDMVSSASRRSGGVCTCTKS